MADPKLTLTEALVGAVTTLSGVVVYLWRKVDQQNKRLLELYESQAEQARAIGRLEGKREAIEDLVDRTLDAVRDAIVDAAERGERRGRGE